MTQADEHLARAEELLGRLDERRSELERLAGADEVDGEAAVDVIGELAEIAKEIESELNRARAADVASKSSGLSRTVTCALSPRRSRATRAIAMRRP